MITQIVLNFFSDLIAGIVGLLNFEIGVLNTVAVWLGGGGASSSSGMGIASASSVSSMLDFLWLVDPFIPRTAVVGALAVMLGLGVAMFVIWLVRFVLSVFTGGGGNVA